MPNPPPLLSGINKASTMAGFPTLPLFVREYIMDTVHLSITESGAYLHLLMHSWTSRDCALPDDDKKLASYVKMSVDEWLGIREEIAVYFTIKNGQWVNKRLQEEFHYVKSKMEARKAAGKKGGKAKARKTKGNPASNATNLPEQNPSNTLAPTPTPTPNKKNNKKDVFDEFWEPYPNKKGRAATLKAFEKYVKAKKATPEELIAASVDYAKSKKGKKDFLYSGYNFINQGHWEDYKTSADKPAVGITVAKPLPEADPFAGWN